MKVYETNDILELETSSNKIMEDSCRYFGSSLDGRKKGTETLIGVTYKAPIIVEETNEVIFFPMSSTRHKDTCWLSLKHIKNYSRSLDGVVVEFDNGFHLILDSSYGIIDNQFLRATRLESALRGRKNNKKRFNFENNVL